MALVPEYKYPDCPYCFYTQDGSLPVGLSWAAKDSSQTWSIAYFIKGYIDVTVAWDVDMVSRSTAGRAKVLTFPNGCDLEFAVWKDGSDNFYTCLMVTYRGVELTNSQYDAAGLSNFKNKATLSNGIMYLPVQARICPICNYYPTADPVANLSIANDIQFNVFIPRTEAGKDVIPLSMFDGQFVYRDLWLGSNYPWPVAVIYTSTASSTGTAEYSITNLNTMNTGMKSLGDGTDKDTIRTETNPDPEDDPSGPGGGGGSYDPTSDPIDFPDLPTGGALTSGMIKGFVIGASGLAALQNKLWDMSFFDIATQFQKLVNQPLDCLISLHALPVLPTTGNSEEIKLGSFPTSVNAVRITNQYVIVDCGSLTCPEYYGSALDYSPYTRCEIFLPFIGLRNLEIDDISKATIAVKYYVDVLTGSCIAYVKCGQSVLYTFTGSCIQNIPATSQTSDLLHNTISAVGPMATGLVTGNPASAAAGAIAGAVNTASSKNHVSRSGDLAGSAGIMGEYVPYLIFHRPKQSLAKNYNKFKGYPTNITYTLSSLSGYTEVEHIHLTGISGATDAELNEIERLLKEGVII